MEMELSSPGLTRILIIDDHALVRQGIRMLIESNPGFAVVGEAGERAPALSLAAGEQPDIILLDLDLGSVSGLDMIRELKTAAAEARILILTGLRDAGSLRRAVRLGASGIVQKEAAAEVLLKAIERVRAGEVWLDRSITASLIAEIAQGGENGQDPEAARIASLSAREREVITLIGEGLSNKRIAERLSISEITVRHHLTSIFAKLDVSDRLELLVYAYRNKLAGPPG
jgi:two-component system, NarL family, nitrate/nitrite response regulator NarL